MQTLKTIFTTLLMIIVAPSMASMINYYPQDFQDKVESGTLTNSQLKTELNRITSSTHQPHSDRPDTLVSRCEDGGCYKHHSLGYKGARRLMFGDIDLRQYKDGEYYVRGVYCHEEFTSDDFSPNKSVGPKKIPDSNILNCEHTWPQSKFTSGYSTTTQKSDVHHLFATNSRANSVRGNNPFGEVTNGKAPAPGCTASSLGRVIPTPSGSGRGGMYFEPPLEHKGNVARALMYFSIRYEKKIDAVQEYYFKKWHKEDPVDEEELARHEKIFKAQGNRNPFIDNPELVDLIEDF